MRPLNNQKRSFFIILVGVLLLLSVVISRPRLMLLVKENSSQEKFTVAACPTFYYILEKIEEDFNTVKTNSTGESIRYLEEGEVDFAIGGRALFPEEPGFFFEVIGEGYSFISQEEIIIFEEEMGDFNFFTDLKKSEVLTNFPFLPKEKIEEVTNVYDYLEQGVVVTSLENTDYSKGGPVYLIDESGSKVRSSRTPTVYYSDPEKRELIVKIKKD